MPAPSPADDGKSCVCEGAVFDAAERPEALDRDSLPFPCTILDTAGHFSWKAGQPGEGADIPPGAAGGRTTRLAICSLLL